jgi:hypothetical protein
MKSPLNDLEPGLVRLDCPSVASRELGLILESRLADLVGLPTNALYFRDYLRTGMKSAIHGFAPRGPYDGHELLDRYVLDIAGRIVTLSPEFASNFNSLIIPANSPFIGSVTDHLLAVLSREGFDVPNSSWEQYKTWEIERMNRF